MRTKSMFRTSFVYHQLMTNTSSKLSKCCPKTSIKISNLLLFLHKPNNLLLQFKKRVWLMIQRKQICFGTKSQIHLTSKSISTVRCFSAECIVATYILCSIRTTFENFHYITRTSSPWRRYLKFNMFGKLHSCQVWTT